MPQITKIRIVNFRYNDGRRLIADELFDLEREDGGAADVLISLANGGGKSVLVQLMMQPVLPKARVAGRKIESFFTRSTDHCFIVLEWSLDESKMKLLTGIAMSASDTRADAETERGFHIKYYTFLSLCAARRGGYDIASLPLSEKRNGIFTPAPFDAVRALSRKPNSGLERYASDDGVKWRERLAQYGIYQEEWRIIEQLNSNEDGLSKFFSTKKTSDAVIDSLILPHIEGRLHTGASKDDSSLDTMLISYARQFSRQQDIVRERETLKGFSDCLTQTEGQAAKLWEDNEAFVRSVGNLFAFQDALTGEVQRKTVEMERLQTQQKKLQEDIRQIHWEKASGDFYEAEGAFQLEKETYEQAKEKRDGAEHLLSVTKNKLLLLECAGYFQRQQGIRAKIAAVEEEIHNRETQSESAHRLAALKYSALTGIDARLRQVAPERKQLDDEIAACKIALSELQTQRKRLGKQYEQAVAEAAKTETLRDKQIADDDKAVETLGIEAIRNLDGRYWEADLMDWQNALQQQEKTAEDAIADLQTEIRKLEERRDSVPQSIAETQSRAEQTGRLIQDLQNGLDAFASLEAKVSNICQRYSMDFDLRFSPYHREYIEGEIGKNLAAVRREEQKMEATEQAIAAVRRGTLHIPKVLMDFLDSTSVPYTSVERYLLSQQRTGHLSKMQTSALLERYPYAAYGIILEEPDIAVVQKEAEGRWLPSLLPVLTNADMNQMLQGTWETPLSIAAFDRNYFADCDSYAQRLQQERDKLAVHRESLLSRQEELHTAADVLAEFSRYEQTWQQRAASELAQAEHERKELGNRVAALQKELEKTKTAIAAAYLSTDELREEQRELQDRQRRFTALQAGLTEEERLSELLTLRNRERKEIKRQQEALEREDAEQNRILDNHIQQKRELDDLQADLEAGRRDVADAQETELVEGDWQWLLSQYRTLLCAQNDDLNRLNADRERLYDDDKQMQWELDRRGCPKEAYSDLPYSQQRENAVREQSKNAEAAAADARNAFDAANRAYGFAESSVQSAKQRLWEFGGEPLPLDQVGSAFERRTREAQEALRKVEQQRRAAERERTSLEKTMDRAENATEQYARPDRVSSITLSEDHKAQLRILTTELSEQSNSVREGERTVKESLRRMLEDYGSASEDVRSAVTGMQKLLNEKSVRGDRYFTLHEHIEENIHLVSLRIGQIDTDLREFHQTKGDLVRQCVIQGKQMYDGLLQLSASSKVRVQDRRRAMIRFDIPETADEAMATAAITAEIEKTARQIAGKLAEDTAPDTEIRTIAKRTVGSKNLLRKYIGADSIVMKAYKIDQNPGSSGYRTWEQTQVNNSGAEKFVVYFAVILALLAYAADGEGLEGSALRRVLVLDNPFGPISSRHVLEPMFEIARSYQIQMICLSDISKSDILSCFDLVIRAIVKTSATGEREQLTHQGNERIEHGFYRSEQMNLF